MPPGGQWAELAQAAPQGLAAVMRPLYSSKCLRKGREKGRKGQGRAGRRERQSGRKKGKHCKRQESNYPQIHRKSEATGHVWAGL